MDIPSQHVKEFTNAVIMDYDLPSKGSYDNRMFIKTVELLILRIKNLVITMLKK
jgi:hypothetical protein